MTLWNRMISFFKADDDNDPIGRLLPGEKHFALAARDVIAAGHVRLYATTRERSPGYHARAHATLDAIMRANDQRPPNPHKDKQHAWSARRVADDMDQWRLQHMRGKEKDGRSLGSLAVDAPSVAQRHDYSGLSKDDAGVFREAGRISEIKNAKPPAEPDEAT